MNRAPISTKFQEADSRFYESISASLNHIADCLENQLEVTRNENSHQRESTAMFVHSGQKSTVASVPVNETRPSLRLLAELVDQLEMDVLKEPVFAS